MFSGATPMPNESWPAPPAPTQTYPCRRWGPFTTYLMECDEPRAPLVVGFNLWYCGWEYATNLASLCFWRLVNWHDHRLGYLLARRGVIGRPPSVPPGVAPTRRQLWATLTLNPRTWRARRAARGC